MPKTSNFAILPSIPAIPHIPIIQAKEHFFTETNNPNNQSANYYKNYFACIS